MNLFLKKNFAAWWYKSTFFQTDSTIFTPLLPKVVMISNVHYLPTSYIQSLLLLHNALHIFDVTCLKMTSLRVTSLSYAFKINMSLSNSSHQKYAANIHTHTYIVHRCLSICISIKILKEDVLFEKSQRVWLGLVAAFSVERRGGMNAKRPWFMALKPR